MKVKMPNLKLHETVDIAGTNMQITRVHGGYAYHFCHEIPTNNHYDNYEYSCVFVPMCKEEN